MYLDKKTIREEYFWDIYAKIYDLILTKFDPYIEEQNKIFKIIKHIKTDTKSSYLKIIELGSGTSNYGGILAAEGDFLVSLDFSITMQKHAVIKYGNDKIKPVRACLNSKIPLKDNFFNMSLMVNSLYVVTKQQQLLQEIARVLKPNGYLLISNPAQVPAKKEFLGGLCKRFSGFKLAKNLLLLILLSCFNLKIMRAMRQGRFKLTDEKAIGNLLSKSGFKILHSERSYLVDANILVLAQKQ